MLKKIILVTAFCFSSFILFAGPLPSIFSSHGYYYPLHNRHPYYYNDNGVRLATSIVNLVGYNINCLNIISQQSTVVVPMTSPVGTTITSTTSVPVQPQVIYNVPMLPVITTPVIVTPSVYYPRYIRRPYYYHYHRVGMPYYW